jgi:SAM-dependent methyltransferase
VRRLPVDLLFKILGPVRGARILDCGCGDGEFSTIIGLLGGTVTGIDISERLIATAKRRAAINGTQDRVDFVCASIHNLPFPSDTFDIAFGKGVLHHVDIMRAAEEISRTLKKNGRAVFEEPIAQSTMLRKIRRSGPVRRIVREDKITPDEAPLTRADIERFSALFRESSVTELQLLSRLERLCSSGTLLLGLNDCDRLLFRLFPFLRRFGRLAILEVAEPAEPGATHAGRIR